MGIEQLSAGSPLRPRGVIIRQQVLVSSLQAQLGDLVEMDTNAAQKRWRIRPLCVGCGRYAPEFEKRWKRFAQAVGRSWRVDETYIKFEGNSHSYRAVDRAGRTVDFRLRLMSRPPRRFFEGDQRPARCSRTITLDGYAASHRGA